MPILLFTIMLSGMGFGLVLPAFLFYAENLGASAVIATAIVGSYSIGQAIGTPIWGRMSDRFGRKPMLLLSTFGMGLSYLLVAYSDTLWLLAVARIMTLGCGTGDSMNRSRRICSWVSKLFSQSS